MTSDDVPDVTVVSYRVRTRCLTPGFFETATSEKRSMKCWDSAVSTLASICNGPALQRPVRHGNLGRIQDDKIKEVRHP